MNSNKKLIIFVAVFLILISLVFFGIGAVNKSSLSVKSILPSNSLPTSTRVVSIEFTGSIKGLKKENVSLSQNILFDIQVVDKKLNLQLHSPPQSDQHLIIQISGITDKQVKVSEKVRVYFFYKDFNMLSAAQQGANISDSNSYEDQFPIIKSLPIEDVAYRIDFRFPSGQSKKLPVIVSVNFDNEGDYDFYLERVREARDQAMGRLKNAGYEKNASSYTLYFSEDVLLSEYGAEYVGDL